MKNPFSRIRERIYYRFMHKFYSRDLLLGLRVQAREESLEYISHNLRHCVICNDRHDLLRFAARQSFQDGLCAEFGVAGGDSIKLLAGFFAGAVYGFDSFQGLPDNWTGTTERKGGFKKRPRRLPANVTLVEGMFADTLPAFLAAHEGPFRFIHMDCDLYTSCKCVLDRITQRLVPGTVIVFDEYFNYPNWQEHEYRAWQEFVNEHRLRYEYLAFTAKGGTVAIRITATSKSHD